MSISTTDLNTLNTPPAPAANLPAASDATDASAKADDTKQVKLTPEIAKQQLNASILTASLQVSISSQNEPLSLVYKSAIENLNAILKPQLGDNAIQNAASQDNSPEATAGRILSFIKSAYALYSQNSKDTTSDSTDGSSNSNSSAGNNTGIDQFMSLIQKGVDMGFDEARGILSSLKVLNGDIASNIDKTYELLKKGMADFVASLKTPAGDNQDGNGGSGSTSTTTSVSISISVSETQITTS